MRADPFSVPVDGYRPVLAVTRTLDAPLDRYTFDWVTVSVVRSGSASITGPHGTRTVASGDLVVLVSGTTVTITPQGSVGLCTVAMDRDWLTDIVFWRHADVFADRLQARRLLRRWRKPPVRFGRLTDEQARRLIGSIEELARLNGTHTPSDDYFHAQIEVFAILDVLGVVLGLGTPSLPTPPKASLRTSQMAVPRRRGLMPVRPEVQQALELMREHPERNWTIELLATQVHMSPSRFAHVFSQTYGKPPIVYLAMIRVDALANMLRTSAKTVEECARAVGWASVSHASRQFHRVTGKTPTEYRQMPASPTTTE